MSVCFCSWQICEEKQNNASETGEHERVVDVVMFQYQPITDVGEQQQVLEPTPILPGRITPRGTMGIRGTVAGASGEGGGMWLEQQHQPVGLGQTATGGE